MVIEIISVVLRAIQVLQGFSKLKRDPDALCTELQKLLDGLSPLYDLLQQAKNVHDFLESMTVDLEILSKRSLEQQTRESTAELLCRKVHTNPHSLRIPDVKVAPQQELEAAGFSLHIRNPLGELMNICPAAANSLASLKNDLSHFCQLVERRNFGKDFEDCTHVVYHHASEVRFAADKIIFHLVPVLTELFDRTKQALR